MITKYVVRIKHKDDIREETNNLVCNQLKKFRKNLDMLMPNNEVRLLIQQTGTNNISEEIT